ncbi:hypothetical protein ACEQPO_08140 [Bacillus sp. SL00103]
MRSCLYLETRYTKRLHRNWINRKKLEEVVHDCGASLYYRRGRLVIRSITEGDDERFELKESTGLLDSPEAFEDEKLKGYWLNAYCKDRITTASIIIIKSKTANGKYRVKRVSMCV